MKDKWIWICFGIFLFLGWIMIVNNFSLVISIIFMAYGTIFIILLSISGYRQKGEEDEQTNQVCETINQGE